jgi:serine/threonine protein kinase
MIISGVRLGKLIGRGGYGAVYAMDDDKLAAKHISFGVSLSRARPSTLRSMYYLANCKRIVRELILHTLVQGVYPDDLVPLRTVECRSVKTSDKWTLDVLLVMDRYDTDLNDYTCRSPSPGSEERRWAADMAVARRLVQTVLRLHFVNVMHRDLKPANILLRTGDDGVASEVVLCDMGMARQLTSDEKDTMLWTDYMTTRWYRAPELCEEYVGSYSVGCDAWSLGCILFELATNRVLFEGSSAEVQASTIEYLIGGAPEAFKRQYCAKASRGVDNAGEASDGTCRAHAAHAHPIHRLMRMYCPWPEHMRRELSCLLEGLLDWMPEQRALALREHGRRFAVGDSWPASGPDSMSDQSLDNALYGTECQNVRSMIVSDSKSTRMYEELYLTREQACDLIEKTCKYVRMNISRMAGIAHPHIGPLPWTHA